MNYSPRSHLRTRTLVSSHKPRTEQQERTLGNYVRGINGLFAARVIDTSRPQRFTLKPNGADPCAGILETDYAVITIEFTASYADLKFPISDADITRIIRRGKYSLPIGCDPNDTTFLPEMICRQLIELVERLRCLPDHHPYWRSRSHVRLHQHLDGWAPGWSFLAFDDPEQANRAAVFAVPPIAWEEAEAKAFWWIAEGTDRDVPFNSCIERHPTEDPERFMAEVRP